MAQLGKLQKSKTAVKPKRKSIFKDFSSRELLLLCIPGLIGQILFYYIPTGASILMPFKDYDYKLGVWGSEWCGLKNFTWIFKSISLGRIMRNTVIYGFWFLFIGPICNIIIALLLFDVKKRSALKLYQTVMCFPNFMSMVVVSFITYAILSPRFGILNDIRNFFGMGSIDIYTVVPAWPLILTIVNVWLGIGMGSMLYFAALMGIDTALFEAAQIDGASHWQQTRYISLPHLVPIFCLMLILGSPGLIGGSFDLFYLIPRDVQTLYPVTDILPTYLFRALKEGNYAKGSAVGFLQSICSTILIVGSNLIVKKISPENSLF